MYSHDYLYSCTMYRWHNDICVPAHYCQILAYYHIVVDECLCLYFMCILHGACRYYLITDLCICQSTECLYHHIYSVYISAHFKSFYSNPIFCLTSIKSILLLALKKDNTIRSLYLCHLFYMLSMIVISGYIYTSAFIPNLHVQMVLYWICVCLHSWLLYAHCTIWLGAHYY